MNYENKIFVIIRDIKCSKLCGLFSFYFHIITSITKLIDKGYIPIIDLESFPNIFNGFTNSINKNPWEYFFDQPFGYKLKDVKKYGKNVKYYNIIENFTFPIPIHKIYNHFLFLYFYHRLAAKYLPIKKEIIKEANFIMRKKFRGSTNILGILARGTDYVAARPKNHPIPPSVEMLIHDIKEMDKKYKYDYYFISTEDNIIRNRLIVEFRDKLKYIKSKTNIEYNYKEKNWLYKNKILYKNIDFHRIYVMNIFILSKCIDIITARTGGSIALFMISDGFRNQKVYYLGYY